VDAYEGTDMNARVLDGEIIATRFEDTRAYSGVRTRRIFAFLLDYFFVLLLTIPFAILVAILGLLTFGLGWVLFSVLLPMVAILYVWNTLGSTAQATTGMRIMGIRLEKLDGSRIDGMTAVVHSVLFWAGNVILTPLVLLVTLFSDRKRTLHDLLLGTVVTRTDI
jgi:uncharacterized RDD family membrane protein YckC